MISRRLLWIVYALASVVVGVAAGHWFFRIFDEVVPPAVTTSFNRTAAHGYFLMHGAILGVVMALWGVLGSLVVRVARDKNPVSGRLTK